MLQQHKSETKLQVNSGAIARHFESISGVDGRGLPSIHRGQRLAAAVLRPHLRVLLSRLQAQVLGSRLEEGQRDHHEHRCRSDGFLGRLNWSDEARAPQQVTQRVPCAVGANLPQEWNWRASQRQLLVASSGDSVPLASAVAQLPAVPLLAHGGHDDDARDADGVQKADEQATAVERSVDEGALQARSHQGAAARQK